MSSAQQVGLPAASWNSTSEKAYAKEAYMINSVGFSCVDAIATNFAKIPMVAKIDGESVPDHPLQKLLDNPNPNYGREEFFEGRLLVAQNLGQLVPLGHGAGQRAAS